MELTPKTRKETFLAAAGGQDVTTPTPVTREEVFLDAIAKGGGGGGSSGGGVLVVHEGENGALDKTLQEIADSDLCILDYYGSKMMQYGVGTPHGQGKFKVFFWDFYESSQVIFEADTPTDYPVYAE